MPRRRLVLPSLSFVAGLLPPVRGVAQVPDSITQRRMDVEVRITNDTRYDGVYRASGIAIICGKLDFMMPHRENSFKVLFPDDSVDRHDVHVDFDADSLAAGTTTTSFYLDVIVRTPGGGRPPGFVVRAKEEPTYGEPGTATRARTASTDTLRVRGIATKGTKVTVEMTVVCHPAS